MKQLSGFKEARRPETNLQERRGLTAEAGLRKIGVKVGVVIWTLQIYPRPQGWKGAASKGRVEGLFGDHGVLGHQEALHRGQGPKCHVQFPARSQVGFTACTFWDGGGGVRQGFCSSRDCTLPLPHNLLSTMHP